MKGSRMTRRRSLVCGISIVLALLVAPSKAYLLQVQVHRSRLVDHRIHHASRGVGLGKPGEIQQWQKQGRLPFQSAAVMAQDVAFGSTKDLNDEISRLCEEGALDDALQLLDIAEDAQVDGRGDFAYPNHETYTLLLTSMASAADKVGADKLKRIEDVFSRMKQSLASAPTRVACNSVILAWSKSYARQGGERCEALLSELWSQYNATGDTLYCPSHSTYVSTLTALVRSQGGKRAAERAEALLEEMELFSRNNHVHLKPTATCVNVVLSAWSKSGAREARERCELILKRMEELYFAGRTELQPDTISFNTVLDCLAQCSERDSAWRAEQLLEHMDELSSRDERLRETCRPDALSFNSVLNGWARSRDPMAANRADAILKHMEQRYANGSAAFQPDVQSYNTVLTAWARSRNRDAAVQNAQQVLQRMEKAYSRGNAQARPNTISFNIMINALVQSNDPAAEDRALEILETMKKLDVEDGRETCRPDCVTYTTIINVFAKKLSGQKEAAETSIRLLEELEEDYLRTNDKHVKPNIRTYTAVIHAIARSRTDPERAEEIMERIEKLYELGDLDAQPDCVCYDALINAFGWSDRKGKSLKCYSIYQKMLALFKSRRNVLAKPDIITCNSVLNACAYDTAETDEERLAIMDVVVKMLEDFQSSAPKFGWPNHITYANTLQSIDKHVIDQQKRAELAEATFWQCCQKGLVSVPVVTSLHRALPWERFADLMSEAVLSGEGEALHFNWRLLPREWTRFAPQPKERRDSRPSQKRPPRSSTFKPSTSRLVKEP